MALKINSAYKIHETAIEFLAQKGVQLNIIQSNSPYVLATTGAPNIVIHPLSKVINGEFPEIKFCGPDCKFPNYEFQAEIGYSDLNIEDKAPIRYSSVLLINTRSDMAFIKYLESIQNITHNLSIYGKKCDSLYYIGPVEFDTYAYYNACKDLIAVDNEHEALKALSLKRGVGVISNFEFENCINFKTRNIAKQYKESDILIERNWNTIFGKLLKEIGEDYE